MTQQFVSAHQELQVYTLGFELAMRIWEVAGRFPETERQILTRQILGSSRLVCVKVARAWQRRRFYEAFVVGLNEAEARSAETQTWIEFAVMCGHLDAQTGQELFQQYNVVMAGLRRLIDNADAWTF